MLKSMMPIRATSLISYICSDLFPRGVLIRLVLVICDQSTLCHEQGMPLYTNESLSHVYSWLIGYQNI